MTEIKVEQAIDLLEQLAKDSEENGDGQGVYYYRSAIPFFEAFKEFDKQSDILPHLTKIVERFETTQCFVSIYETDLQYLGNQLYILKSVHKNNGKSIVRFGNACQIACMKNTYVRVKTFELE